MSTILVVDNYDSFVFNLVQYLEILGARCEVFSGDGQIKIEMHFLPEV